MCDGDVGEPVEDAVIAGEFREEHHAGEEEVDVECLRRLACPASLSGMRRKAQRRIAPAPTHADLREARGPEEHERNAQCGDSPDEDVRKQWLVLLSDERRSVECMGRRECRATSDGSVMQHL